MKNTKAELTVSEETRYEILKRKIKAGIDTAFGVGLALTEIRDNELYRADYDTFEEFCKTEYEIERRRAYQLIEAAEMKMCTNGTQIENERQARALANVAPEDRKEVMDEVKKGGKVTAAAIAAAAKKVKPKTIELDKEGHPIPDEIMEDWNRAEGFSEMLRKISEVRCALQKGFDAGDIVFAELTNGVIAETSSLYGTLKSVIPHSVCTTCQGHGRKKCSLCKGRGFISHFAYKMFVPEEIKVLRQKAKK